VNHITEIGVANKWYVKCERVKTCYGFSPVSFELNNTNTLLLIKARSHITVQIVRSINVITKYKPSAPECRRAKGLEKAKTVNHPCGGNSGGGGMYVTWQIRQALINPTQQGPLKVQQGRTFQASYGTQGFITVFTRKLRVWVSAKRRQKQYLVTKQEVTRRGKLHNMGLHYRAT